jgi:hypothetical protein
MNDTEDKPDEPAVSNRAQCTELEMRDTLVNLEEFALMMSHRSSIHALEIIEVAPPGRDTPPTPRPRSLPAAVIPHPAVPKKGG